MLKLAKYAKPFIFSIIVIIALLFVQAMTDLALPGYVANIVNEGIAKSNTAFIFREGRLMLLVTLLGAACTTTVGFLSAKMSAGLAQDLRRSIFRKVESFSNYEMDSFSTASLITRTTNDIQQIQMLLVMLLRSVFFAPILGIGGILKVINTGTTMSWIIVVAVIALFGLVIFMFTVAIPKFKIVQKLIDKLNLVTRESLTGILVIRSFNTQQNEEKRFDSANIDLTRTTLFLNRVMAFMMPSMMLIMNGVTLLILWVGSHQIDAGHLQVGDMLAFMQYTMQIISSFLMISMMFVMLPRAAVSAQRIQEVLATEPSVTDPPDPQHFEPTKKGLIEFRNVSFRYPGAEDDVLKDISFTTKAGQTTAIIGSTGSGKSTLTDLICRFYDVTAGAIFINGTDIRNVTQKELREKIGYVPQHGILFSGTIESNLKYADEDASENTIAEAAAIAQAMDFIEEKPEGFASPIAQGGANVSGGQKQRLSIARALVKKPEIYIFDDSFSALDFQTDAALRKALRESTDNATVLIVTQRVNTIMNAGQIIVLDQGRIEAIGTHRELLESSKVYQEIASSQLSKEELVS